MVTSAERIALMASAAAPSGPQAEPYPENADWEAEREVLLARSDRRAWAVAVTMAAIAAASILALVAHGAWYQTVAVPIVVDKATGETSVAKALDADTVPAYEALDKHYAWLFVLARERYDWSFLQLDYDTVAALAAPAVFRGYAAQFEGAGALQAKLADATEWKVRVVNIRLEPQTRPGRAGVAVVTFTKQVASRDRAPESEGRYLATVAYEYHTKLLLKEKDRIRNPFGFVVTAYRSDPDINSLPGRAGP
jgi:type IV secretion system protein VirB8